MASLFITKHRTSSAPAGYAEGRYEFLDRVKSRFFERVRDLLETWYGQFPDTDGDLLNRFRSPDDTQHGAAFWELYLHAAYTSLGLDIDVHPDLGSNTDRSPDFMVHGSSPFVVEAKLATGRTRGLTENILTLEVYDAINELRSDVFFVWPQVRATTSTAPSHARIKRHVADWLDRLDADAVLDAVSSGSSPFDVCPTTEWEENGWLISFQAIPKDRAARGRPGRLIGMTGNLQVSAIDDHTPLLRRLKAKTPARYGGFEFPYLIAVLVESVTTDEIDVASALFGREAVIFRASTGGSHDTEVIRQADGLWHSPGGFENKRVSGVLVAMNLSPWDVATVAPRLWLNPYTHTPLPEADRVPWATALPDLTEAEMVMHPPPRSLYEIFGLAADWPGEIDLERV